MLSKKTMALSISAVLSVLVLASLIWPLTEQRNRSIDRAIESDFLDISSEVDEYYSEKGRLPNELDDLSLDKSISDRAKKYEYQLDKNSARKYELCARFKTNTTDEKDRGYETATFDLATSVAVPERYGRDQAHQSGFDCLDYETFGFFYDEFNGFNLEDSFDFSEESTEPFLGEPDIFEL